MSEESNVCKICGGVKRVNWTISFEECHPVEMHFDPAALAGDWHLCPGHPGLATKHDGFLDEKHEYEVSWWQRDSAMPRVYIEETSTMKEEPEFVGISPAQALSLLAWLRQEEAELRRLAGESTASPAKDPK